MMTGIVGVLGLVAIVGMMTSAAIQDGGGIAVIMIAIAIMMTADPGITTIAIGDATANQANHVLWGLGTGRGPRSRLDVCSGSEAKLISVQKLTTGLPIPKGAGQAFGTGIVPKRSRTQSPPVRTNCEKVFHNELPLADQAA
jgi:hypothetical protein